MKILYRFPTKKESSGDLHLEVNNIPYAWFSIEQTEGKKTVFLTEHTLLFVLNGEKIIHLENERFFFKKGELVFIKKGIYVMSEFVPKDGNFEVLLIYVPGNFIKKFYSKFPQQNYSLAATTPLFYKTTSGNLLDSFITHYKQLFDMKNSNAQFILENRLEELFLVLSGSGGGRHFSDFCMSLLSEKADIGFVVNQNIFQPITIEDFARLSGRSLAAFKRDFELFFQSSPRKWINRQRLIRANELLKQTKLNVSEVAFECGYENVSHFIRIYKSEFGETPNETRKAVVS